MQFSALTAIIGHHSFCVVSKKEGTICVTVFVFFSENMNKNYLMNLIFFHLSRPWGILNHMMLLLSVAFTFSQSQAFLVKLMNLKPL